MQTDHGWVTGHEAWKQFTEVHPELGYRDGPQHFYNFLRRYRDVLVCRGAMRRAKRRFWIAHKQRFVEVAFDVSTEGVVV
jgi:hypothetical protein